MEHFDDVCPAACYSVTRLIRRGRETFLRTTVLRRQQIAAGLGGVLNIVGRDHGTEPFAEIARVQPGVASQLVHRHGAGSGHGFEDAKLVADVAERAAHGGTDVVYEGLDKFLHFRVVERNCCSGIRNNASLYRGSPTASIDSNGRMEASCSCRITDAVRALESGAKFRDRSRDAALN